jgi:hypothetical protein
MTEDRLPVSAGPAGLSTTSEASTLERVSFAGKLSNGL